jgi:hypothetical protein
MKDLRPHHASYFLVRVVGQSLAAPFDPRLARHCSRFGNDLSQVPEDHNHIMETLARQEFVLVVIMIRLDDFVEVPTRRATD